MKGNPPPPCRLAESMGLREANLGAKDQELWESNAPPPPTKICWLKEVSDVDPNALGGNIARLSSSMAIIGAIVGATGVGKTAFALSVAQKMNAEIICMDSRQVYQGFRIGTAQPSPQEKATVPHHLVDFWPADQAYSAAQFAQDVKTLCQNMPHTRFLLVGGTGMYLQTLCEGLSAIPPADPQIRESLRVQYESLGVQALYQQALLVDPGIRTLIMPGDFQRLLRVLEVYAQGAGAWSDWQGKRVGGVGSIPTVWFDRERSQLYTRIHQRVQQMFSEGWVAEVNDLAKEVPLDSPAWQSLGYREIHQAINSGQPIHQLIEPLCQQTRRYAKRQLTWFRNKTPATPLNLDSLTPEQVVDQTVQRLGAVL